MSNRMKINPKKIGAVVLLGLALVAFGEVVFMYRLLSFIDWLMSSPVFCLALWQACCGDVPRLFFNHYIGGFDSCG